MAHVCGKPYEERAPHLRHPKARKLFEIQASKDTNLCVAADVTSSTSVLELADQIGDLISVVKTHVDILEDFDWSFIEHLTRLARKHNFMIFEDRKFADIGSTVGLQYTGGIYKISEWADFVTAHVVSGESVLSGLDSVLLLTNMSTSSTNVDNTDTCLTFAQSYPSKVSGFIGQRREYDLDIPLWTPGVSRPSVTGDGQGQVYRTPKTVVDQGADVVIVGRGIVKAGNKEERRESAKWFREEGWRAYLRRCTVMMA